MFGYCDRLQQEVPDNHARTEHHGRDIKSEGQKLLVAAPLHWKGEHSPKTQRVETQIDGICPGDGGLNAEDDLVVKPN